MKICGQILKYISQVKNKTKNVDVRGIIVGHDFEEGLKLAVPSLNNVELKKYKVNLMKMLEIHSTTAITSTFWINDMTEIFVTSEKTG